MNRDTADTAAIRAAFRDLVARTADSLTRLRELSPAELNAHPGGHPNSPAWLLWHTGRELDLQLAHLTGGEQVWNHFRDRFDLGEIGDTLGFGRSDEEARSVRVDDFGLLVDYISAALDAAADYADTVTDWGQVIDHYDDEPITRQVRMTSILIDALEHLAQVAYVAGMPRP